MKVTAELSARTETNGSVLHEHFYFSEHRGMLNVTYSGISDSVANFGCFRFTNRAQGNAFYLALKRLGAEALDRGTLERTQESALKFVRGCMSDGVRPFNELLATLILSGYVEAARA